MTDQSPQTQQNQTDEDDLYVSEEIVPGLMSGFQYDAVKTSGIYMSNFMMAHCLFSTFTHNFEQALLKTNDTIEYASLFPTLFQHENGAVTISYSVEPEFGYELEMINNFEILNKYQEEKKLIEFALSEFIDLVTDACPEACDTYIGEDLDGVTNYTIMADSRADLFRLLETLNIENVLYASEEVSSPFNKNKNKGATNKDIEKELKTTWKHASVLGGQKYDLHGPTGRKMWEMSLFINTPRVVGYETQDQRILGLRSDMATCRYSLQDIEQALNWEGIRVLQQPNNYPMVFAGIQ